MFTVRVAARTQTEGREVFVAQLQREQNEVPEKFEGCERFAVYSDPSDPDSTFIYEEWATRESFDAYAGSDYFKASGEILFPLMSGSPDSAYYESERVGP
jgi:quinol monooxygenase YgiN